MRFTEAVEEFMLEKAIETSERTQTWYRERLQHFRRNTGITELDELTPGTITRYLHAYRHHARASVQNYRRALAVFANWCYRRKLLDDNPFEVLPPPKRQRNERPSVFTQAQVHAILREAKRGIRKERDAALILVLLDTGIRIGEAANLELDDIEWNDKMLRVHGKTGERDVPFCGRTKHALNLYVHRKRRAEPSERHVFVTHQGSPLSAQQLGQHVRRMAKRAGVTGPKLGPHTFRHTFSHYYLINGGDALSLQRLLGHTTPFMTANYARMQSTSLRLLHAKHSPVHNLK